MKLILGTKAILGGWWEPFLNVVGIFVVVDCLLDIVGC